VVKQSVFVQIPAYRDWELSATVRDAVAKASGDNLIRFGIHNCALPEDDIPLNFGDANVRIVHSVAPQNIGVLRSRKIANSLYDGETYYLQTDAHMRFVAGWDKLLVDDYNMYQRCGVNKPLITQYPGDYQYDNPPNHDDPPFMETTLCFCEHQQQFAETLIPGQKAVAASSGCHFHYSVSGGFIFTGGDFASITPNEKIAFWGEEPLIAVRAFTHGYDILTPTRFVLWHLYASGRSFEHIRRHHVWQDFPDLWRQLDAESKAEYKSILLDNRISDDGLGSERTLAEFEEFTGLDFRNRTIKCWHHGV
jgi:hypothetical protein